MLSNYQSDNKDSTNCKTNTTLAVQSAQISDLIYSKKSNILFKL